MDDEFKTYPLKVIYKGNCITFNVSKECSPINIDWHEEIFISFEKLQLGSKVELMKVYILAGLRDEFIELEKSLREQLNFRTISFIIQYSIEHLYLDIFYRYTDKVSKADLTRIVNRMDNNIIEMLIYKIMFNGLNDSSEIKKAIEYMLYKNPKLLTEYAFTIAKSDRITKYLIEIFKEYVKFE